MVFNYFSVVTALISNGDEETAEGRLRSNALYILCDMNPGQSLPIRTLCVELGKMPSLMLRLSLKDPMDLVCSQGLYVSRFLFLIHVIYSFRLPLCRAYC